MMLRGLLKLTWIELKVFLREPLGAIGAIGMPVIVFLVFGRLAGRSIPSSSAAAGFLRADVAVLASLLIVVGAVISLITIISIYRESGILKRLRATPLHPQTILAAQVLVKLILSAATLVLMLLAGKRYFPAGAHVPWLSFSVALVISTWSILSLGFVIASIVPTARFAQPIGALILYPMVAFSGLFVPIQLLPPVLHNIARILPLTYAVNLLQGIWSGDAWAGHLGDVAALVVVFVVCTVVSTKVFRWQ
ncbi:MAG TPA: ABC transporter permease [Terracidiphilus sp.]|jgi:ABC-2 type transport system permease protein|nr:ABC transporter permease [Terracidiphilus sp.]